jgi:glutamate racemase
MKNPNSYHALVGVIGGTTCDTKLGVAFLKKRKIKAISCNISRTPCEQTLLQLSKRALTSRVLFAIEKLIARKVSSIFIYCNSLSGAIDLQYLRKCFDLPILTPLETYDVISNYHKRVGLIAANCQSLGSIEKSILKKNPNLLLIGFSSLLIVNSVEQGLSPKEIIQKYDLISICNTIIKHKAEIIVLGCTHYSYFMEELDKMLKDRKIKTPLFDPSESMYKQLISYK